jgi:pentapeptide MXKDX repeat protein
MKKFFPAVVLCCGLTVAAFAFSGCNSNSGAADKMNGGGSGMEDKMMNDKMSGDKMSGDKMATGKMGPDKMSK